MKALFPLCRIRWHAITIVGYLFAFPLCAQQTETVSSNAEPVGGVSQLANQYFSINFTDEQLTELRNAELEFVYKIDLEGQATLLRITGIRDQDILDKFNRIEPPKFNPKMVNGVAVNSIYTMTLHFPNRQHPDRQSASAKETKPLMNDVKSLELTGKKLDMLFGLVANGYNGNPAAYLNMGWGGKLDVMLGTSKLAFGMTISFFANGLKKPYPINSTRAQNSVVPTGMVGLALNRTLFEEEKRSFNLQAEFNYAVHNVVSPMYNGDPDYVQFRGFSPGLVGNYMIRIGNGVFDYFHSDPVVKYSYINFHVALRGLSFNSPEASGLMMEFGISYRVSAKFVKKFEL